MLLLAQLIIYFTQAVSGLMFQALKPGPMSCISHNLVSNLPLGVANYYMTTVNYVNNYLYVGVTNFSNDSYIKIYDNNLFYIFYISFIYYD